MQNLLKGENSERSANSSYVATDDAWLSWRCRLPGAPGLAPATPAAAAVVVVVAAASLFTFASSSFFAPCPPVTGFDPVWWAEGAEGPTSSRGLTSTSESTGGAPVAELWRVPSTELRREALSIELRRVPPSRDAAPPPERCGLRLWCPRGLPLASSGPWLMAEGGKRGAHPVPSGRVMHAGSGSKEAKSRKLTNALLQSLSERLLLLCLQCLFLVLTVVRACQRRVIIQAFLLPKSEK